MHKLSKPQCRIIGIQRGQNVQSERAKERRHEQARRWISQGQTSQGAKESGDESTRGRKSQKANNPGSEGAKKPGTASSWQNLPSGYPVIVASLRSCLAGLPTCGDTVEVGSCSSLRWRRVHAGGERRRRHGHSGIGHGWPWTVFVTTIWWL